MMNKNFNLLHLEDRLISKDNLLPKVWFRPEIEELSVIITKTGFQPGQESGGFAS